MTLSLDNTPALFTGLDYEVPLLDGSKRRYVNLDNGATTPPLQSVMDFINSATQWYSSVHRGTGFKSQVSTHIYSKCRKQYADFLGIDPDYHVVAMCGSTTDAVNRLANRFHLCSDDVVLTTEMEHHANMLPWRYHARTEHILADHKGYMIDLEKMEERLQYYNGKVKFVAVTGASNVTGIIPPIKEVARLAHKYGAYIVVDAAQLIAHRPIEMGTSEDPEHIDFLVFSGHKMYAPFGSGGLVGPREFFDRGSPGLVGGGAVDLVTLDDVEWSRLPGKEEAGSPNLMGIGAIAAAMKTLSELGMDKVAKHERELTAYTLKKMSNIERIKVFGGEELDQDGYDRLGVIPFKSEDYNHAHLAAILGYEWGIGVRSGCFCAHPYIIRLLEIDQADVKKHMAHIRGHDSWFSPGLVRISLGLYNTREEIDYFIKALTDIQKNGPKVKYIQHAGSGQYSPEGFDIDMDAYI